MRGPIFTRPGPTCHTDRILRHVVLSVSPRRHAQAPTRPTDSRDDCSTEPKTSAFVSGCGPFPKHASNRGRVLVQWGSARRIFVKFCLVVFVKWDPPRFYTRSEGPHHRENHRRRNFHRESRENQRRARTHFHKTWTDLPHGSNSSTRCSGVFAEATRASAHPPDGRIKISVSSKRNGRSTWDWPFRFGETLSPRPQNVGTLGGLPNISVCLAF